MRLLFACDLAARASGWVVLDMAEQPYRVVAHGAIAVKGEWGPIAWEETRQAWDAVLLRLSRQQASAEGLWPHGIDCVVYEVPGWAGQSGDSKSGHGTSRNTRRMLDQAEALFGAVAAGYTRRIMAVDQGNVKLAITGHRRADKTAVSLALELRRQDGEWTAPEGEDGKWSEHEVDALAIGLAAAALLKQEVEVLR